MKLFQLLTIEIFLLVSSCCIYVYVSSADTRRHSRQPKGFGRHSDLGGHPNQLYQTSFQNFQKPSDDGLEYGSLQQPEFRGEDGDDIEQISRDDDDLNQFSGLEQQPNTETLPKYTQSTTSPNSESPEAKTAKGTFIGLRETINDKVVYAFYGVPYALPPTGNKRFSRPEPVATFTEPYDATHLPNACPQTAPDVFNDFSGEKVWLPNTNTSEDCLYLNIWVPESVFNRRESELAPVLFWIYGGGFFSGSNSLDVYNGATLAAQQELVVVNVQYRLGPLGFLYLEQGQGNLGLIDQSLGLQWTNQNIKYFGGNPDSVTVAGESAGSASVAYHLLSPLSKGYIKRGIMSSGLPAMKYSLKPSEEVKEHSLKLAKSVGCNQTDVQEILECLRNVDSDKLITNQWKLYKHILEFPFIPIVDGYFLPDHPYKLIEKGRAKRADLILGTVQDEGTYFILYHYLNYFHHLKPTPVSYDRFLDIMNELFYDYNEDEREAIINKYTNWENPENGCANRRSIGEAIGDAMFICPHRKFADTWVSRGLNVYYYHFTQRFESNPWGEWMGVMHGDDISLLFGPSVNETTITEKENEMITNFMSMVGQFLRDGVPSSTWKRYTSETPVFLDVNSTVVSNTSTSNIYGPKANACAFWNKLLPAINENAQCKLAHAHGHPNAQQYQNNLQPPQYCSVPHSAPPHLPPYPPAQQYPMMPMPQYAQTQEQANGLSNSEFQSTPEPPSTSTSQSCQCTVQEVPSSPVDTKSTSPISYGFVTPTPPPAFY